MVQLLCPYLTRGLCNSVFSKIILIVISGLVMNGIAKKICICMRYILLEETLVQFVCTYLAGGVPILFFQKYFLVISRLLLHGIAENFRWNLRTARDDIHIISVILPH